MSDANLLIKPFDLITVGESMLRFSVPAGDLLLDSPGFEVQIAGAESNVAIGVARMGHKARWLSRLTNNVLGKRIVHQLAGYGVDCSGVIWTSEDRIGTYYLEFGATPRPTTVTYDRAHSSASKMTATTFELEQIAQAKILHLTGITAALSTGCYELLTTLIDYARANGVHIVFDVNFRAMLWSAQTCAEHLTPLLSRIDTLLVGQSDAKTVFGITGEPDEIVHEFQQRFGIQQVAVTLAEAGAIAIQQGQLIRVQGYPVQIVDRIGAGDAFAAGVICGILRGDFDLGLRYGTAMSALQLGLRGDVFRLSEVEVKQLIETGIQDRPVR